MSDKHPPISLLQLEPEFIRYWEDNEKHTSGWTRVSTIGEAQGVMFVCPKCLYRNGMQRPGVHMVVCWSRSRGVPDGISPGPGRWRLDGTDFHDLTLNGDPGSRSVDCGCWHGFITGGVATDA